jgi:uncharacterized protein (TIGR03083 family)
MTHLDRSPLVVLRTSQDRLAAVVGGLDDDAITGMSYCDEWTIAQVCSHLGSGAEIGLDWLAAAREHRAPMGHDDMPKVWDRWNAMSPRQQVEESLTMNERHVDAFETLDDDALAAAQIELFGMMQLDGVGLAGFRIPEHSLHTWDIAVALDPSARVLPEAIDTLVEGLAMAVSYLAKPARRAWSLTVRTTAPVQTFALRSTGDAVSLAEGDGVDGTLDITAEAFVRLAFGRLDERNADGARSTGQLTLDDLRAAFPGI